jgi:hypothetical protein
MLVTLTGTVAATLASSPATLLEAQQAPTPQPLSSPNAPMNENVPAGLDGSNIPFRNGDRPVPPATWLEIKSDAQKLLDMATDFKKQVDSTNLSSMLPLALIQAANHIEKLAKQIQTRMKA